MSETDFISQTTAWIYFNINNKTHERGSIVRV